MKAWRKFDRASLAALALGLVLRALFVWVHPRFSGDALVYGDLAHNMLAHHTFGFTEDTIRPTLIRLPGFPIVLAACFLLFGTANYLAVLWVQVFADLLGCWLLSRLAQRLFGDRTSRAVLWLACMCPFTANYTAAALTETSTILGAIVAFFAFERWLERWLTVRTSSPQHRAARGDAWALLIGFALMFSIEVRPDQALLAIAVVLPMLWVGLRSNGKSWPERLRPAVLASIVIAIPLVLWGARNWRVFHVVQPLSPRYANDPGESVPFGFQRWYRTWAVDFKATVDVYWTYDGSELKLSNLPPRAFDSAEQKAQTKAVFDAYNVNTSATPAFDTAFARIAQERVSAHPLRFYLELPLARLLDMWVRPRTELMKMPIDWWNVPAHPKKSAAEIVYMALDIAYLLLAAAGLVVWARKHGEGQAILATSMLGFVILRCALLLTLDNSEPRYTLECFPVVILLAGIALGRSNPLRRPLWAQ